MSESKKIIELILSDEKLKNSKSFSSAVYKDEPILKTASQMNSYVPPRIIELQQNIRNAALHSLSAGKTFYEQARLMEDYEDDYDYSGDFFCYYPTYRSMNTKQMRGYFSWRTRVRRGDIRKTSLSFAFVYVYELLHLVGVSDAQEGFDRLSEFGRVYGELDPQITPYIRRWLRDLAVYYDLDKELFCSVFDTSADEALITLMDHKNISDEDMFGAVKVLSSYNIVNSKLYKICPEDCKKVICAVYRTLCEYSEKRRKKSLFESYFGNPVSCPYEMFGTAVFYDRLCRKSFTYAVNDVHKYECVNGRWSCVRFHTIDRKSKKLGRLIKTIDSMMRKRLGISPKIDQPIETKLTTQMIGREIDAFLEEKKRNTPKKIDIDLSKLNGIRQAADITRDKLITESETEEHTAEMTPAVNEEIIEAAPDNSSETELPLDENEYELLRCLLYGISIDILRSKRGVMLSVLADSINEKLFDMFGDTVIAFEDDSPVIIEDYADELKGIVKK
ncbi:MAG: TerB N-terminal domain-containing protein [Oscillospiraceae bacterium]|nr:TerB N-terminal domain-containing protein [Oscillospiraceae bacterium]